MKKYLLLIALICWETMSGWAQTFTSSNLPIIVLNTNGQVIMDDPKITARMGIIDNGPGNLNRPTDPFNHFDGLIGIEIRGSSSQSFPKKQYGVEIRDATGEGISVPLLGMPEEEDWVLFAPYNDKTLMRDALAYQLGSLMGRWAPRNRFCEVVLNGQYEGVYVLVERVKRDDNRVELNRLNPDEISGNGVTGGYILKIDKNTGNSGAGFESLYPPLRRSGTQKIEFQYEYPAYDEIVSQQRTYIRDYVMDMEKALMANNFYDPNEGFRKWLDEDSFIDFFLMQELTKNVDGYRLSAFFHKKRDSDGGLIHMGPIWDFNLGFGNADYCTKGNPEGWVLDFNSVCGQDNWLIPFWWDRLFRDGTFNWKVRNRWQQLRANQFQTDRVIARVDSMANLLQGGAQQRNFQRWPVLGQYVWPNYYVGNSFEQEVAWLKNWILSRLLWLDQNINLVTSLPEGLDRPLTIRAYPNPTRGQFTLEGDLQRAGQVEVIVRDVTGRVVGQTGQWVAAPQAFAQSVDLSALAQGLYLYEVRYNSRPVYAGKVQKE